MLDRRVNRSTQTTDDEGWLCAIICGLPEMGCLAVADPLNYFWVECESGVLVAREVGQHQPVTGPESHHVETVQRQHTTTLTFRVKLRGHRKELLIIAGRGQKWQPSSTQTIPKCWETCAGHRLPSAVIKNTG